MQETTFFIPIITPRYFTRSECRAELLKFAAAATALGVQDLILPIRYVDVRNFNDSNPDEAIALVSRMQYVDWSGLRLEDEQSAAYRLQVNRLAERLAELSESIAARPAAASQVAILEVASQAAEAGPDDEDAPGLIDLLADFEPALQRVTSVLTEVPTIMDSFSGPTQQATADLQQATAQNKPFASRILIFKRLANELDGPSAAMERAGNRYGTELMRADPAVRAFIDLAGQAIGGDEEIVARQALTSIQEAVETSRSNVQAMKELADSIRANVKMSRDLRPALRRIETGIRGLIDAQAVLDEWDRLARETGLS